MLNNRINRLEDKLKTYITIEDIIRFIRNKDSLTPNEQHRIISSKLYQQITEYQFTKNSRRLTVRPSGVKRLG